MSLHAAKGEIYPGAGRKWQRYESPNFELYSANSDRESRDVLERMELLRALFLDTFKLKPRLPQPVTIYYFDRHDEFDGYRPPSIRGGDSKFSGFCNNFPDRTVISLAPARSRERATEVVYHEYIHYLFRITEQNPAPWFNEGMAELYSTMEEDKEWLQMGQPVPACVFELQMGKMMPFEQLFAVEYDSPLFKNSAHTGMFYAQSWAFLHYCRYGLNKIPPEKMSLFLRVAGSSEIQEKPAEFRAVCRELLGMDYPELLKELQNYVTYGRFQGRKVKRPAIASRATYTVRPVPREEMTIHLAELSLRMTDSAQANLLIRDQLAKSPDSRLCELLGAVALRANEPGVARERFRAAMDLGTTNAAIFRELGRLESNAVFENFNLDYHMPAKRAADLRHLLAKSLECAPEQSQGYELLAWVEASVDQPDIPSINRIQERFKTLNDQARTLLALVIIRQRLGQTQAALDLLGQIDQLKPSEWVQFHAELVRARLEGRPVNRDRLPRVTPPAVRFTPTFSLPQ